MSVIQHSDQRQKGMLIMTSQTESLTVCHFLINGDFEFLCTADRSCVWGLFWSTKFQMCHVRPHPHQPKHTSYGSTGTKLEFYPEIILTPNNLFNSLGHKEINRFLLLPFPCCKKYLESEYCFSVITNWL